MPLQSDHLHDYMMTETSVEGSPPNSGGSNSNLSFGLLPSP